MSAIRVFGVVFLIGAGLLSGCGLQDDVETLDSHMVALSQRNSKLEQRVSELELQNRTLQEKNDQIRARIDGLHQNDANRDEKIREQLARMRAADDRLKAEFQELLGKTEMADHLLKQKAGAAEDLSREWESRFTRLEELIKKNTDRAARLEEYLNLEPSGRGTPGMPPVPRETAEKPLSEDELYAAGKQAFDNGEMAGAREKFERLITEYPQSKNADNAQFWIGETYYREKWYEKSILEYQKVIEKYPQGNKVPAAMLKQGLAFSKIDDKANARLVLKQLLKKHPKSTEAGIAEQKLKGFE